MGKFNNIDTLLIVGRSEYVKDNIDNITELSKRYTTLAINNVPSEIDVDFLVVLDVVGMNKILGKTKKDNKILITLKVNKNAVKDRIPCITYNAHVLNSKEKRVFVGDSLAYSGFSHDLAIAWGIKEGYKNIILAGVADFTKYHYDDTLFRRSARLEANSIMFISHLFQKYINIYTLNDNSKLLVPRVDIKDILS